MVKTYEGNEASKITGSEKSYGHDGIEVLMQLSIVAKTAKIYEPNNLIFVNQLKGLFSLIQDILKTEGEVSFMLRENTLYYTGTKMRFGFSNYNLFRFMSNEFHKKEISLLSFEQGLSEKELTRFIVLFAKKSEKTEKPFDEFQKEMIDNEIQHIAIEKIHPSEMTKSSEKYAVRVFMMGIKHLKDIFELLKREETVPVNTTRRLIQSMFNHLVDNEPFMHGLTNIKNYDEYTLNHSVNVCLLALAIGRRLGLEKRELVDLGLGAFFHDFGKTEIPLEILSKPAKLDEREREIVERHPHRGAEKLVHLKKFSHLPLGAINVAMEHHVKEDMTGYPRYQKKKNVNLYSKIVKTCDFFDALTTKRPYRSKVFTRDEVLKMMLEQSGVEFNPILMKIFVNLMGAFPIGTLILLNSGEIGIVFEINMNPAFIDRPKVKIIADADGNKADGEIVDLTEKDQQTQNFKRTIVKSLDAEKYQIKVSDYFLAQAQ